MNIALLSPKVWLEIACVAIVAGLLWYAYHWAYMNGSRDVQAQFDAYKLKETQIALQQEADNRVKELAFQTSIGNLTNAYIKEKSVNAASATAAADSLRLLQSTINSTTPKDSTTPYGLDDTSRARFVVGQCATTLAKMAEDFDASEARLSALQEYVKAILK